VLKRIKNDNRIEKHCDSGNGKPDKCFVIFTRWGRTDTARAALAQEFNYEYEAMECFENILED
jgi:hypothetical protein